MNIGFIGLGIMGESMCENIVKKHDGDLFVFDFNEAQVDKLVGVGAKKCASSTEVAKNADVIVTTIGSCGTGTDIPGITAIISCSPYVSKITAEQVFGRIRYCGKICDYYDIYDTSVQLDVFWWKSRSKTLKHLALNNYAFTYEPNEEEKK